MKDHPMPYVVAVIDEFSDFMMQDREEGIVERRKYCTLSPKGTSMWHSFNYHDTTS